MTFDQLEERLLKLGPSERAKLASRLLESLDVLSDAENEVLWEEEALRRDVELEASPRKARPAREVFRDARAKLR